MLYKIFSLKLPPYMVDWLVKREKQGDPLDIESWIRKQKLKEEISKREVRLMSLSVTKKILEETYKKS